MMGEAIYTTGDIARRRKCSRARVYQLIAFQRLRPFARTVGGLYLFAGSEIDRFEGDQPRGSKRAAASAETVRRAGGPRRPDERRRGRPA